MDEWLLEVVSLLALWAGVVAIGSVVSFYAVKAWKSSGERTFGFLAGGLLALSAGSGTSWFGLYFMGADPIICEAGATAFMVGGFGAILFALRSRVA